MTKKDPTQTTGNAGPEADRKRTAKDAGFDVAGNVEKKGEDPSPDDRARGETSGKDRARP
jgi:hypothetical protein